MSPKRCLAIDAYHVGIVCALPHEMTATSAMLDEEDEPLRGQDAHDGNSYTLGWMSGHNVVIACLPTGVYGTNAAATVAKDMLRTFTSLRFGLLVGIGGGIPNVEAGRDIRLGDVVVSRPEGTLGGVVQYDMGKAQGKGMFIRKGALNSPPNLLLTALARLQARAGLEKSQLEKFLNEAYQKYPCLKDEGYLSPGTDMDRLQCARCQFSKWWWFLWLLVAWLCPLLRCDHCDDGSMRRPRRRGPQPVIHYGTIASGNQVVKHSSLRDRLGQQFSAVCVEMEAAGLMNSFPCIVVRGICDYADSHKNDAWQRYAAIAAAAYTKDFLQYVTPGQISKQKRIQDVVGVLTDQVQVSREILGEAQRQHMSAETRYQNQRHRRCHQAFKTCSYEQHKDVNPDRADGTCQWVLRHPQYVNWDTSDGLALLWISADPGCGKSVLAKSLVDYELRTSMDRSICYFFFKENEEQDRVATALCAILHQLFSQQPGLIQHAIPIWEKNGDNVQQELSELWRTLLAATGDREAQDVCCVLDALDECRLSDRRCLIEMLARFHRDGRNSPSKPANGRLRFLVTSRPYDDIQHDFQRTLQDLPTIRLRGEEENDQIRQEIDGVIRDRVTRLAEELQLQGGVRDRIKEKLLQMEQRTYLWLHLAVESIYTTYRNSFRPEEESIELLPSTVDDAYEKILNRVGHDQRGKVWKILQIVVGSRRPLTVPEMAIALGIAVTRPSGAQNLNQALLDPGRVRGNLRQWCGLFVFINHDRIYLIHQTAKEFLLADGRSSSPLSGWKHCLDLSTTETEMTRICVEFLSMEDVWRTALSLAQRLDRFMTLDNVLVKENPTETLVAYAAEFWPSHLRAGQCVLDDVIVGGLSTFYDTTSSLQPIWFAIYWRATNPDQERPRVTALQLAALLGHEQALVQLLQPGFAPDINKCDNTGCTALTRACRGGYEKVVQMLLEAGADANARGDIYGNALQAASAGGHEKVVQMLLEKGAEVNAQGGQYNNALQAASWGGHEEVVQMLLEKEADDNAQGGEYGNALYAASSGGHEKVVQMLLEKEADVNAQGGEYGDALYAASRGGHEKVVQMLLEKEADVNARGLFGNTLQAASWGGHEKVVQMLLEKEADVNAQGGEYGDALYAASWGGHEKVVQMLLEKEADVNAQGGEYGNALCAASRGGHEKVVQMLLEKEADVNAQGGEYGDALCAASRGGHEKVVQMLLEKEADVNAQGGKYGNALQAASSGGYEKVVQMLLEKEADINAQGGEYGNALQAASEGGYEEVVQMLLEEETDVNAQGGEYGNALQAASSGGHEEVVQILLNAGVSKLRTGNQSDDIPPV